MMTYLDYNATTPVDPEVADAMLPYLRDNFGNPSSSHRYGREARGAVDRARAEVAGLLRCEPDEVIFTSGGSESNNLAIKGFALADRDRRNHIVTSAIEHPAVLEVCRYLERLGFEVTYLPVDRHGLVDAGDVRRSLRSSTSLVSIMLANNEVGTLEPVAEIAALTRERGIAVHTDAAQAVGKVAVECPALGVDLLSIAGHKLYAPKGIGALYVRRGIELEKMIHGAPHERNRRAGTENVLEIVGLGKACEIVSRTLDHQARHLKVMRDLLQGLILNAVPDAVVNGHPELRLPNTLSISFPGIAAGEILSRLDPDVACSAGAACHSDRVVMSHVLDAMGVSSDQAMGTLRLSTGRMTTEEDVREAAAKITGVIRGMRG